MNPSTIREDFFQRLGTPLVAEKLFDHVEDIVFFVKDDQCRYVSANRTLLIRCGLKDRDELLGRRSSDLFPAPLGVAFLEEDMRVISEARGVHGHLTRHFYPGRHEDWCLTHKEPLFDREGRAIGLVGISRDLNVPALPDTDLQGLSKILDHIRDHLDEPLRLDPLAESAGLSVYQLDQRIRALFHLSAGQYITKVRIDAACHALTNTDTPIANIALDCGYGDQSAFTRQFKQSLGITPGAYRGR